MNDQHRHECEARTILKWPKNKRVKYYEMVEKHRGPAARKRLMEEVKRQWQNSSAQSATSQSQ